jgi:hypothetical protein
MTIRPDVSLIKNNFRDSLQISQTELQVEQDYYDGKIKSVIDNHIGSGVLLESLTDNIIFNSDELTEVQTGYISSNTFDGRGISPLVQPTDVNLGNQLEITLSESSAVGRHSVKISIVGLDFNGELIQEKFYFYTNETQVTSKHFAKVLSLFFNDFKGNDNCSRNLGGTIVIKESKSFQISRDPIMIAQDVEPDFFWRDFKKYTISLTLEQVIQEGIGSEYSVDGLNINTTGISNQELLANDVSSQIGEKFYANTDNIQKITMLLSVSSDDSAAEANKYDWSGDLVISVYKLQTSVLCDADIIPDLAIDFDPNPVSLAQVSFNQASLKENGYVLTDVLQPVDFVFSDSKIGKASGVEVGKYYAVSIQRNGSAATGNIYIGTGNNNSVYNRLTVFSGTEWVDVEDSSIWYQVWTDAIKITSGKGYDSGTGIQIDKTKQIVDSSSASIAIVDNEEKNYSFSDTGFNTVNIALVQAVLELTSEEQDQLTGNYVESKNKYNPALSLISQSELTTLQTTSNPFIVGCVKDVNPKLNSTLEKTYSIPGLARGDNFCILNPDADLISLNLVGSVLTPNKDTNFKYKIVKATYCTDGYGDVNGDGEIDDLDITLATSLIGESLYFSSTVNKINDGTIDVLQLLRADVDNDGYVTSNDVDAITSYVNKLVNSFTAGTSFSHMCLEVQPLTGRFDGYYDCTDGYVRLDGYGQVGSISTGELSTEEILYQGSNVVPILQLDSTLTVVPFVSKTFQITPKPYWQPWQLLLSSSARYVQASFTYADSLTERSCSTTAASLCSAQFTDVPTVEPGRNDTLIPGNIIIDKGALLNLDGTLYKQDLEIKTIELRLPITELSESKINIFEKLLVDKGDGKTFAEYPAAKYYDCSTVQPEDLALNKVKFEVAIQSIYKVVDGYDSSYEYVVINNPNIGVKMDNSTGILTLNVSDVDLDNIKETLITKISVNIYLKKAGFNNTHLIIPPESIAGLISS